MKKSIAGIVGLSVATATIWASRRDGFEPKTLRRQSVLITGSSSGIGENLAYEYSSLGARIMLTARREDLLKTVAERCRTLGATEVHIVPADMAKQEDRMKVADEVGKVLGGLDHLILNHADLGTGTWTSSASDMVDLSTTMNVNFVSYVDMASRCFKNLERSEGHVAVISSMAGKTAFIGGNRYAASKHALHGFFGSWRQELRVSKTPVSFTICVLGPIATDNSKVFFEKGGMVGVVAPQDAAQAIIRATENRKRELYYGKFSAMVVYAHHFFPTLVDDNFADYMIKMLDAQF